MCSLQCANSSRTAADADASIQSMRLNRFRWGVAGCDGAGLIGGFSFGKLEYVDTPQRSEDSVCELEGVLLDPISSVTEVGERLAQVDRIAARGQSDGTDVACIRHLLRRDAPRKRGEELAVLRAEAFDDLLTISEQRLGGCTS